MDHAPGGSDIDRLIQLLARLPGLGPRSARRAALHLIERREQLFAPLTAAMQAAMENVKACATCGNVDTASPCAICSDPKRDKSTIIVVETVGDLWALERASATSGLYHVLGGTLSPLDGIGPDDIAIAPLVERARNEAVKEVVLAVNATVEGQTTAHYITEMLMDTGARVSRLAHGVPVGGELDYLDDGTLSAAIRQRQPF